MMKGKYRNKRQVPKNEDPEELKRALFKRLCSTLGRKLQETQAALKKLAGKG